MNETMVRMINCFGDCRIKFCAKWQNLDDMAKDVWGGGVWFWGSELIDI